MKKKKNKMTVKKLIRFVKTGKGGAKVFLFLKDEVLPWVLVAAAAAAYWFLDVDIPKEKKKKTGKKNR